ncbi:hypothetical protein NEOLEDRAFT_1041968, partial [Neolentinus lepideus HHB14362 ss-1]
QKLVGEVSAIVPIRIDMCKNSCVAYTGPYAGLEVCECGHYPRYDSLKQAL